MRHWRITAADRSFWYCRPAWPGIDVALPKAVDAVAVEGGWLEMRARLRVRAWVMSRRWWGAWWGPGGAPARADSWTVMGSSWKFWSAMVPEVSGGLGGGVCWLRGSGRFETGPRSASSGRALRPEPRRWRLGVGCGIGGVVRHGAAGDGGPVHHERVGA